LHIYIFIYMGLHRYDVYVACVTELELKASGYASHINIISVETHIYKYIYMQAKSQVEL
jgi:hypothetical protein